MPLDPPLDEKQDTRIHESCSAEVVLREKKLVTYGTESGRSNLGRWDPDIWWRLAGIACRR